jgi:hypothetical protein
MAGSDPRLAETADVTNLQNVREGVSGKKRKIRSHLSRRKQGRHEKKDAHGRQIQDPSIESLAAYDKAAFSEQDSSKEERVQLSWGAQRSRLPVFAQLSQELGQNVTRQGNAARPNQAPLQAQPHAEPQTRLSAQTVAYRLIGGLAPALHFDQMPAEQFSVSPQPILPSEQAAPPSPWFQQPFLQPPPFQIAAPMQFTVPPVSPSFEQPYLRSGMQDDGLGRWYPSGAASVASVFVCRCAPASSGTSVHGPSSGWCSCDIYKICSEFGPIPISEEVATALATYEHDWSKRGCREEARRYFLSVVIRQALGSNLLMLQSLVPTVEAANARSECSEAAKGMRLSTRNESISLLLTTCLPLRSVTSPDRKLGTIFLAPACLPALSLIFQLLREAPGRKQQSLCKRRADISFGC